jgi:hypothetical protein
MRTAIAAGLLGGACNALAVFSNGGMMPVRVPVDVVVLSESHQYMTPDTNFKFLCDIYRIGSKTFSIGDGFAYIGIALTLFVLARLAFHWRRRHASV